MKRLLSSFLLISLLCSCDQQNRTARIKTDLISEDTVSTTGHKPGGPDIDMVKVSPNISKILLENEHVRVVEYSLNPGQKDEWHTHPPKSSYVVSGGKLRVFPEGGESFVAEEKTGSAFWTNYSGKHYVENVGTTRVTIVLTEIKALK